MASRGSWVGCALLALACSCSEESDWPGLLAGPMLGHVAADEVRVWYQVSETEIAPELRCAERGFPASEVQKLGDGCRVAIFRGLPAELAGSTFVVRCRPKSASDTAGKAVDLVTSRLPSRSNTGVVKIAFGSCCRDSEYRRAPIFSRIPEHEPDVMLFAGDNSYFIHGVKGPTQFSTTTKAGDWDTREKMLARHLATRRLPSIQKLLRSTPCYATWDDHDYGPNDAAADFDKKNEALRAFQQAWANPSTPPVVAGGVAHSFRRGPVEIWMLDNRWFKATRDKRKRLRKDATIWGHTQFEWLKATLLASEAPVKVVLNGTQIFEQGFVGEGHWQEAKKERAEFESFLRTNRIGGVIVLSGDRHHHELMRVGPVDGARIYEFTSSPFQYGQKVGPIPKERSNATRVWGTRGNGFGLVTVDVKGPREGTIRFEVFGENGRVPVDAGKPCRTEIALEELSYER